MVTHKVPVERSTVRFFLRRCWNEGVGKAHLARLTGINASTAMERRHATRVIPRAFGRELWHAVMRRNVAHLQRSAFLAVGLMLTTIGLLTELVRQNRRVGAVTGADTSSCPEPSFRPVCLAEWDVLTPFSSAQQDELWHLGGGPVRLLVRMGTEPLGYADFECEKSETLPGLAAAAVSAEFRSKVNSRLSRSGLPVVSQIPVGGLTIEPNVLAFGAERQRLLADAPEVSVVVCTRDRPASLAACLRQLARQEYPSFEIVVVDNAPSDRDAVPAELASLDLPVRVRYVLEPRGGLSWARNAGWQAAAADIVAFIDDDEVADTNWISELIRGFSARPEVGVVTGMILAAEVRTEPQEWFEQFGGHSKGRGFTQEIFDGDHPQSELYPLPPFGAGGNMAFRRAVLSNINGFNVALGGGTPTMGGEDTFAFTQALLSRHTVVYQPTALVWHHHYDTLAGLATQLRGYGTGLTAFYAALISGRPRLLLPLARLIPNAVKDMRGKDSIRTATMRTFPADLLGTHRIGMLKGVAAYALSVIEQRRKGRTNGARGRSDG